MGSSDIIDLDPRTEAVFERKGYRVVKYINKGAFGSVYKAENIKRNEIDAVKVMDLEKVAKSGMDQKYLDREIQALIKIRHPNVLQVNDIFRCKGRLYIFMEFAPNGSLKDKLKQAPKKRLGERQSQRWFKQCVEALYCMHVKHRIAHRDIKVDNVLLDKKDNAKLSDYGFAREFDAEEGRLSRTFCGTAPYYAPEIVGRRPYNPFLYDTWSMAVMLFLMLNGKFPFNPSLLKSERTRLLRKMKEKDLDWNPDVEDQLSDGVKELLDSMFTFDANRRPNVIGVRDHPWVRAG